MSAPFWKQLSTAALLGTARDFMLPALPTGLEDLVPGAEEEGAVRLVRTAAVAGLAQAAGLEATHPEDALPTPAAGDDHPPCRDTQVVAILSRVASEGPDALVAEACQLLTDAGQTLPYRLLPSFFHAARRASTLREPVLHAAGTRGAWLAAQNPDWRFAATAGVEEIDIRQWEEGDVASRVRYLSARRLTDGVGARELLEKTLPQESARDRVALLAALQKNLTPEDEPLLQGLLAGDRSKEVRTLAAELLSALPESAFARRVVGRIETCVMMEKKLLRKHWVVTPPAEFPVGAAADGMEEKPPASSRLGARAWWLQQITARTPLSWWTTHTGMTPVEVVLWAARSEWKEALLAGLSEAVTLQAVAVDWLHAIFDAGTLPAQEAVELLSGLQDKAQREAWLRVDMSTMSFSWWLRHVLKAAITWTPGFWQAVEKRLITHLQTDASQHDYELRNLLPELACRQPLGVTSQPSWPVNAKSWPVFESAAHRFQQIIEQRQRLRELLKLSS